jgi:hypothetical protein
MEDVDGRAQPFGQLHSDASRFFELLHLVLKDGENGSGRVAAVQSGGKWTRENVLFRLSFIRFQ